MPTRMLPVWLTRDELAANNARLVAALETKATIEADKKTVLDDYKAKLDTSDAEIADLQRIGASGREDRPVDVFERRNLKDRVIETVRSDSGDTVSTKPMTPAEYDDAIQEKLPLGERAPADDGPSPLVLGVGCIIESTKGKEGKVIAIDADKARVEWSDTGKVGVVSVSNIGPKQKYRVVQSPPASTAMTRTAT